MTEEDFLAAPDMPDPTRQHDSDPHDEIPRFPVPVVLYHQKRKDG
eukprot:CAMPEP_0194044982 /NCGR_PEP_ID=MMETSP0009_2-20130614/16375_1 /TAXON_ID=210454 /ORGANISM="Grammatophora oceanica, Strain CCMP 410" /LENGTH=44 /DNA_ID= /DNA_START= /DNA_END= /DNA_ORIENTATION=